MTVAAFPPYTYYWGDGVTLAFAYPFEVERPEDFAAYQNDVRVSNFSLSGVGNETGGMCTFTTAPGLNVSVLLLRQVPLDQETLYPAYGAFPAAAHEKTLDRLCMQVWQLQEQLERASLFKQTIRPPWRNLEMPEPLGGTVLGWDAAGQQWTLYPNGVSQIPVDPISGIGWGKNTIRLAPAAGTSQTSGLVFPSGVLALALTVWVEASFGTSLGLQQVGLGTPQQPDCWGLLPGLVAGTESTAGLFLGYSGQPQDTGGIVALTAYGGAFDGSGAVYVTGHFTTFKAARAVGYSFTPGASESPPLLQASETQVGMTRYGTPAETTLGLLDSVATHPAGVQAALNAALDARIPLGTALTVARYDATGRGVEQSPMVIDAAGNLRFVAAAGGTNLAVGIVLPNGTAPSGAHPTNALQMWAGNRGGVAGKSGLHVRSADGTSHVLADFVGIGTVTPTVGLHHVGTSTVLERHSATVGGALLYLRHSRGTEAAPAVLLDEDVTGYINGTGYVRNAADTGNAWIDLTSINSNVDVLDAQGRAGGRLSFWTATSASATVTEKMRLSADGMLGVGALPPTAPLDVAGNGIRIRTARTPASATAAGNQGDMAWDANFVYVCVAANSWKRAAIAAW